MHYDRRFSTFLILWTSQTLSRLGSSLTPFALVLWAYGETSSALATAGLTVSLYIPYILLSLPVGALCDRLDGKRVMLVADSVAALCTLTILVLWTAGGLALWHLYMLNCISGLAQCFQQPAGEVATSLLTPPELYQKAAGLNALASSVVNLASPAIATALYAAGGLGAVIVADLSTFLVAFLILLIFVRVPVQKGSKGGLLEEMREGLSYLVHRRGLLEVILFLAAINFIASVYNAALPAMVLSRAGEAALAAVQTSAGVAMLAGGLVASALPTPKSRVRVIVASLFVSMGSENFILAFSRSPAIWCLGAFIGWMCIPVMNTNLEALLRSSIPTAFQGRVYSARNMLQFFTIPLGYLVGGWLVDEVAEPFMAASSSAFLSRLFGQGRGAGAALVFGVIGILGLLVCLFFSRLQAMRRLEEEKVSKEGK